MHTTMHSPKMTRSLQQISDKFGGSLPSVNKLSNLPNKLQLQAQLQNVQTKVSDAERYYQVCVSFFKFTTGDYLNCLTFIIYHHCIIFYLVVCSAWIYAENAKVHYYS